MIHQVSMVSVLAAILEFIVFFVIIRKISRLEERVSALAPDATAEEKLK